jgi:hypothetical protein
VVGDAVSVIIHGGGLVPPVEFAVAFAVVFAAGADHVTGTVLDTLPDHVLLLTYAMKLIVLPAFEVYLAVQLVAVPLHTEFSRVHVFGPD